MRNVSRLFIGIMFSCIFSTHLCAHWFGVFASIGSVMRNKMTWTHKKKEQSLASIFEKSVQQVKQNCNRASDILDGWEFVPGAEEEIPVIDRVSPFAHVIKRVNAIEESDKKAGKKLARMKQDIENTLEQLEDERQLLFQLANRGSEDFTQELDERYQNNFARLGIEPEHAYETLGFDTVQAPSISLRQLKKAIAKLDDEFCQRQMDYLFRNEYAKQEFDAYLAGAGEMEALKIDLNAAQQLQQMSEEVVMAKCWLGECKRAIQAKLKNIRS